MADTKPAYPECEKWADLLEKKGGRDIINFLTWLDEHDILLVNFAEDDSNGRHPIQKTSEQLLCEYGGVDTVKREEERQAMLRPL